MNKDKTVYRAVSFVAEMLLECARVKTAIKYLSPKLVVKATLRHKLNKRDKHTEMVVSIGKPNFAEKKFVKDCVKAKEPFPVKGIQVKYYPEKKK